MLDLSYRMVETPEEFSRCVESWSRQARLWIDIEVADYYTRNASVASLQVRDQTGAVTVVDCVPPTTHAMLHGEFIPKVMCNPTVEKWAHNADYERRFLGRDEVKNLNCTLALAKQLPYYRLPTRSASLASLVKHFWNLDVDKSYQKLSWGVRPLSAAAWAYAAWDPEWCYRLWSELKERLAAHKPPTTPEAIAERFTAFDRDYLTASKQKEAIWQSVRDFMIEGQRATFGAFNLSQRETTSINLEVLLGLLERADPHALVPCNLSLTKHHQELLGMHADAVKAASTVTGGVAFRVPSEPAFRRKFEYELNRDDPTVVERDYERVEHEYRLLASERRELKTAMKAIMREREVNELVGFRLTSGGATYWRIEPRRLVLIAPGVELGAFRLVAKVKTLLEMAAIPLPEEGVEVKVGHTLRWRPQTATYERVLAHDVETERFDQDADEGE